jgi:Na+-driven multidrug efflux pump
MRLARGLRRATCALSAGSGLLSSASDFLTIRSLGAPATVLMMTLQGVFRGLQDARTPLAATVASSALNVVLAPLLIFVAGWGVKGAAVATVIAQVRSGAAN